MTISVIIPTFRRPDDLLACLEGLRPYLPSATAQEPSFPSPGNLSVSDIIVSDDARDPNLRTTLAERFPSVTWLPGPQRGPAANRNHGAGQASGDWLVFLDDDCLPQPGWLEGFAEALRLQPHLQILEGRTCSDRQRLRHDEEAPVNETGGYLWSCNLAIRKACFVALNGFDESFPHAAMEDVDFRARLRKAGFSVAFVPAATVVHPWRILQTASLHRRWQAHFVYWSRHPDLRPPSQRAYFFEMGFRSIVRLMRRDLPTCGWRGLPRALYRDCFWMSRAFFLHRNFPNRSDS